MPSFLGRYNPGSKSHIRSAGNTILIAPYEVHPNGSPIICRQGPTLHALIDRLSRPIDDPVSLCLAKDESAGWLNFSAYVLITRRLPSGLFYLELSVRISRRLRQKIELGRYDAQTRSGHGTCGAVYRT